MKTRTLLLLAVAVTVPVFSLAACGGDDNNNADGGPQNQVDAGNDVTTDTGTGTDAGADAPNACATGIVFDNAGRVPSWPNPPQP